MAFNPTSTIYLCNVPFDSSYKNQIYFSTPTQQLGYFTNAPVFKKTLANYLTVRKTLPDGSPQSSVKVDMNIDELQSLPCNYMVYQNAHHGTKHFFAFITKFIYVNEGTTEIVFETDVYQTWLFDVELKQSYVVREHSETDEIGDNVVPEKFNFQDYTYTNLNVSNLTDWGYLVATTEPRYEFMSRGTEYGGVYQGLYFYYYHKVSDLNNFLDEIEAKGGDCIVFISVIPEASIRGLIISDEEILEGEAGDGQGLIIGSIVCEPYVYDIDLTSRAFSFDGYTDVKNNKLYTSPFFKMIVTNHNGEQAEYTCEDFSDPQKFAFLMYCDISANPSVTMIPTNYKGINKNYDCGISISGFPQCAFNSDTFKLWLAKNQYSVGLDLASSVGQIVAGVGVATATGGAGTALGVGQVVSGVQGVLNTVNSVYQASKEPNKYHSGSAKNNLLTVMKKNNFEFFIQTIKKDYAETVDNFFTMYGYQTNKLKVPNVSKRPHFNYVQTIDVNIVGGIPSDDMLKLKAVYNNGVTLWKSHATIGDYSVNNAPVNVPRET